jgi:hypothetical protein
VKKYGVKKQPESHELRRKDGVEAQDRYGIWKMENGRINLRSVGHSQVICITAPCNGPVCINSKSAVSMRSYVQSRSATPCP